MIDAMDVIYLKKLFCLPSRLVDKTDRYYLLHWSGEYLLTELMDESLLWHQDVFYHPNFWDDTTIETIDPSSQYQISFRRATGNETGIALIRKLK
jgi:hypothetical protein